MGFEELKAKAGVLWSSAPYEELSTHHTAVIDHVIQRLSPLDGVRLLDLATGTGELATEAAKAGAVVTAQDIAPGMIESARRRAADEGLEIAFDVGDAEATGYPDASFDVVASSFGVMFAPDHAAVAAELARLCRPGGRLAMTCWLPQGGVGNLIAEMRPFQPPPPPGAGNPMDWGRKDHLEELLGGGFELSFEEGDARQVGESGQEMWDLLVRTYPPTKGLASSLDPARRAELEESITKFYEKHRDGDRISFAREYVLVLGERR